MSLDNFKNFVKSRPSLVDYVKNGEKTWQDFYEIYELYGENSDVWKNYINKIGTNRITIKEFLNMIKNIDMSEVQNSINSVQKAISYLENILKDKEGITSENKVNYERRPLYKYFDD